MSDRGKHRHTRTHTHRRRRWQTHTRTRRGPSSKDPNINFGPFSTLEMLARHTHTHAATYVFNYHTHTHTEWRHFWKCMRRAKWACQRVRLGMPRTYAAPSPRSIRPVSPAPARLTRLAALKRLPGRFYFQSLALSALRHLCQRTIN